MAGHGSAYGICTMFVVNEPFVPFTYPITGLALIKVNGDGYRDCADDLIFLVAVDEYTLFFK
jgi:hypothetical protein